MADNNTNWYPPPGHPREDTDRIIFDNLYQLRGNQNAAASPSSSSGGGSSASVTIGKDGNNNPVFLVGGKQFHTITFSNGALKGIS